MNDNKQEKQKTIVFIKNCKIVINGEIQTFKKDSKKIFKEYVANKLIKNKAAKEYVETVKEVSNESIENSLDKKEMVKK